MVDRSHLPDRPDELVVRVPAKINLIIRVLDRLANGYHQLWSIMHTVDLFDVLRIRVNPDHQEIVLQCGNSDLPVDRRNLVYRSAEAVLHQAGMEAGVEVELTKSIPMAAGLGGGSSDAGTTHRSPSTSNGETSCPHPPTKAQGAWKKNGISLPRVAPHFFNSSNPQPNFRS